MIIQRKYTFEAAHFLPNVPTGHKCKNLHGHSYTVIVRVEGKIAVRTAWVMDFGEIDVHVDPIIRNLDHHLLNEVPGLRNPTAEAVARYIWRKLGCTLTGLAEVEVWETDRGGVIYRGGGA